MLTDSTKTNGSQNTLRNMITRCRRCNAALLWDNNARAYVLQLANNNIVRCLECGCDLIYSPLHERFDEKTFFISNELAHC